MEIRTKIEQKENWCEQADPIGSSVGYSIASRLKTSFLLGTDSLVLRPVLRLAFLSAILDSLAPRTSLELGTHVAARSASMIVEIPLSFDLSGWRWLHPFYHLLDEISFLSLPSSRLDVGILPCAVVPTGELGVEGEEGLLPRHDVFKNHDKDVVFDRSIQLVTDASDRSQDLEPRLHLVRGHLGPSHHKRE